MDLPPIVVIIIALVSSTCSLLSVAFTCRLLYIIITRCRNNSSDPSSSNDGEGSSHNDDEEQGLISEGEGDGTATGGDRCCICLEQMPDAAGSMWRSLRVAICMEKAAQEGENSRRLMSCGHVFHAGCINEWKKRSGTCPTCRTTSWFSEPSRKLDDEDVLVRMAIFFAGVGYSLTYFL